MERFDALVVGAGPAGSTAAYRLAREGANVLLLDKACFPRDKPCGGGLSVRAMRELPFDPQPVVERVIDRLELSFCGRRSFVRGGGMPLASLTQRRRLDHFLVGRPSAPVLSSEMAPPFPKSPSVARALTASGSTANS